VVVSVMSVDRDPVPQAAVAVAGTPVHALTGQTGSARLAGLGPGVYKLIVSARGYIGARTTVRLARVKPAVVTLSYQPPLGTFVWKVGPADSDEFWVEGRVTKHGITATEYDWTCTRNPKTGKPVGSWNTFAGALPYAVAPFTIAPEWVRRRFPPSGPPRPREGCQGT
jgi:Carboxypeptidase regulatory-like domain